jgi:AcrR family transcriptional regulator
MFEMASKGKERELQQREQHFLEAARRILLEDGYPGLSINRVAEMTGFSRGTVYLQFGSKEELITVLGLQCRHRLLEAVEYGARYEGRPRERMVAVGESILRYVERYPQDQRILKIIDSELILAKVSGERQAEMNDYDVRVFLSVLGIIEEAVRVGDLEFRDGAGPAGLCFASWAMMDGAFAAVMGGAPLEAVGIPNPVAEAIRNGQYLLDGYGWRPLSREWDYEGATGRIRAYLDRMFLANAGDANTMS